MLQTFKDRLKAKYAKLNLTEKRINTLAEKLHKRYADVADEAAHDTAIDALYDEADLAEIAKLDELFSKPAPQPTPEPAPVPKADEKPKTEIEELKEMIKGLTTTVQTLSAKDQAQTISSKLKEKLKAVPEKVWAKRVLPTKDEEIDAFVTEATTDWQEIAPAPAEQGFVPGKPFKAGTSAKINEQTINNLVDQAMNVQPKQN